MSSIGGVGGFRPPSDFKPPRFEKIDANGDGGLSLDEFKSGGPRGVDDKKAEALFKTIDGDGDGSISKTESDSFRAEAEKQFQSFLFGLQSSGAGATDEADDIFAALDADADGGVARDEFLAARAGTTDASGSGQSSELLRKLFDAIDGDKDRSISRDEDDAFRKQVEQRADQFGRSNLATQGFGAYGASALFGQSGGSGPFSYSQTA